MATRKPSQQAPQPAQLESPSHLGDGGFMTPRGQAGHGDPMLQYIWQQVSEINKGIGDLKQCIGGLQQASAEQQRKLDKLEAASDEDRKELHRINLKINGAGVLAVLIGVIVAWIGAQVWDVAKPVIIQKLTAEAPQTSAGQAQQPAQPPAKP